VYFPGHKRYATYTVMRERERERKSKKCNCKQDISLLILKTAAFRNIAGLVRVHRTIVNVWLY
jgi:hypothetical protein